MRLTAAIIFLTLITRSYQQVGIVAACNKVDAVYPRGSSEYIADLLKKPYRPAEDYVQGISIGTGGHYHDVSPGDIVGFPGHLHWLAVYIGRAYCPCMFMDVPYQGSIVRCLLDTYGSEEVFKFSYPTHFPGTQNSTDGPTSNVSTTANLPVSTGPVTGAISTDSPMSSGPTTHFFPVTTQQIPANQTGMPSNSTELPQNTTGDSTFAFNVTVQTMPFDQNSTEFLNTSTLFPVTGPPNASQPIVTTSSTFLPSDPPQTSPAATQTTITQASPNQTTTGNSTVPGSAQSLVPFRHVVAFSMMATLAARHCTGSSYL